MNQLLALKRREFLQSHIRCLVSRLSKMLNGYVHVQARTMAAEDPSMEALVVSQVSHRFFHGRADVMTRKEAQHC